MKKTVKKVIIALLGIIFVIIAAIAILFWNELKSLSSLKKINENSFYTMTYSGDYGFDDFLKVGATSDADIEKFVTKRLLKGLDIDLGITGAGCTAFTAKNPDKNIIYGRNFDFKYSPPLLVKTAPKDGYASVSMVNLSFAGYSEDNVLTPKSSNSFLALAAPYLPFDGMNEKGLVVALLAVPEAHPPQDKEITLNTTTAIRLMLDKAQTIDEAVELIKKYNIYFSGDVECHYLVADKTGKSVIVEFWENEVKTTESSKDYQIASNFIAYNNLNIGEGYTEFERYDIIANKLKQTSGILSEKDAMDLLNEAAVPDKNQWAVVYNTEKLSADICVGGNHTVQYSYDFNLKNLQ